MRGNTPLAAYLRKHGLTQTAFARRCTEVGDYPVPQPRISEWTRVEPRSASKALLRKVTGGEVDERSWERWRRRQKRAGPLSRNRRKSA